MSETSLSSKWSKNLSLKSAIEKTPIKELKAHYLA